MPAVPIRWRYAGKIPRRWPLWHKKLQVILNYKFLPAKQLRHHRLVLALGQRHVNIMQFGKRNLTKKQQKDAGLIIL